MVRLFAAGHLRPGEVILGIFRGRSAGEAGRRERRWVVVSTQRVLCFSCIGRTFAPRALLGAVARNAVGSSLPFDLPDPMTGEADRITCEDVQAFLVLVTAPTPAAAAAAAA